MRAVRVDIATVGTIVKKARVQNLNIGIQELLYIASCLQIYHHHLFPSLASPCDFLIEAGSK